MVFTRKFPSTRRVTVGAGYRTVGIDEAKQLVASHLSRAEPSRLGRLVARRGRCGRSFRGLGFGRIGDLSASDLRCEIGCLSLLKQLLLGQRGDEHCYASSFSAAAIDLSAIFQSFLDLVEDSLTFIDVGKLPTAESQGELYSVATEQEFLGSIDFDHEIVSVDLGRFDANFLQLGLVAVSFGLALLLGQIVLVFTVVENAANRGGGVWYDFHQVQTGLSGHCLGIGQ